MRAAFFGVLAVFSVGCSNGPSIGSSTSAEKLAPSPDPCVASNCVVPELPNPVDLAKVVVDYGRPDLTPEFARLVDEANHLIIRQSPAQRSATIEALYAKLDGLAN